MKERDQINSIEQIWLESQCQKAQETNNNNKEDNQNSIGKILKYSSSTHSTFNLLNYTVKVMLKALSTYLVVHHWEYLKELQQAKIISKHGVC